MIGYILLGLILSFKKKWIIAISCFISTIILFTYINSTISLLHFNQSDNSLPLGKGRGWAFIIASFNVLMTNTNYEATIKAALSTQADIIAFEEIDENWAIELEAKLKEKYPYYKLVPQNNLYGIGIFSKNPLSNVQVLYFEETPNIAAEILIFIKKGHYRKLFFIASHSVSPESFANYKRRDKQIINQIANFLQFTPSPKIATGDYNATPWDATIINFKKLTQLQDSRKSLCATFPTVFWPAIIPLDYIFYSNDMQCVEFKTINNGDSDHRGIVGKYVIQ